MIEKIICITHRCNQNCLFCFNENSNYSDNSKNIRSEIYAAKNDGIEELAFSGGEPTINPDFFDLIRFGKSAGFKKIRIITNGRMFAYPAFCIKALEAGLDEITFSIHSHIPELYDEISDVKGSGIQAVAGLLNLLRIRNRIVIKVYIVLTALNVDTVPETIIYFHRMGVKEFDISWPFSTGKAFSEDNKKIFSGIRETRECMAKLYNYSKNKNMKINFLHFDPMYLDWGATLC